MARKFAVIIFAAAAAFSCRSRIKPASTPAPAVSQPSATRVMPPSDFVGPTSPATQATTEIVDLNRTAHERGWIADAFFDFDRSTLRVDAQEALDRSARWLRDHPQVTVTLEGHCDERGTEQYNLALGIRRAEAARQYLAALGIDHNRIAIVSYGEEKPFASGSNEEAWEQNRRAHFVLRSANP